VSVFL